MVFDLLLTNACVATMDGAQPFGLVRDGAVGVTKGKVAWTGRAADLPAGPSAHPHRFGEEGLVVFEVTSALKFLVCLPRDSQHASE